MAEEKVDQTTVVVNADVLNEDPTVMDFMALSPEDLSNPSSDKGVIISRTLTEYESKTISTAARPGGHSNVELEIANAEDVCFVPGDAELRFNYTSSNFWAYPRYGAAGMLKRVQIGSMGTKKTVFEDVADYNKIVEPLRDIFMSNSYVNQHLKPIEGAHWSEPVDDASFGNITVAGATVTCVNNHGFTAADVGAIIAVRKGAADGFCRITAIPTAKTLTVQTDGIAAGVALADSAAGAGSIRYFPAQALSDGKTSKVATKMQERACGWSLDNRPAEMFHSLYGTAYLAGGQVRYLMLTGGLRLQFELAQHAEALFTPFADVAGANPKYHVSGLWYQMEQLQLGQEVAQDITSKLQDMAMDEGTYGPFLHLDCHFVLRETKTGNVNNTAQSLVWDQTYSNIDNFIVWRQPVDSALLYDRDTTEHVSEEFEKLETRYTKKNWEMVRRSEFGSHLCLFNQLYKETELGQSAQIDTINLEEFSRKPYVVLNMQRLRVSDNYTGIETNSTDKFVINMKYYAGQAPAVQHEVISVGQFRKRVVLVYDEKSGFMIDTVRE